MSGAAAEGVEAPGVHREEEDEGPLRSVRVEGGGREVVAMWRATREQVKG